MHLLSHQIVSVLWSECAGAELGLDYRIPHALPSRITGFRMRYRLEIPDSAMRYRRRYRLEIPDSAMRYRMLYRL